MLPRDEVGRAVSAAEERLGGEGRILLRPSGTEPVVRVMVEHADEKVCMEVCEEVAGVVAEAGAKERRCGCREVCWMCSCVEAG